jgi:cupin 2 domain-containing protein
MDNLFDKIPTDLTEEVFETLLVGESVRIERIVSHGHASPKGFWYDQEQAEWIVVLSGSATLRFEDSDQVTALSAGDFVDIPAHRKHRVEWTDPDRPTVWLAVFHDG